MSDFFSPGWSIYVAVVTLASLAGCLALLVVASRARTNPKDDTGHTWDGDLRELNNPMPRWWMVLFVITIVFGVGYLVLYPGLGSSKGLLGWSSAAQYRDEQARADAQLAGVYAKYASTPAPQLARDKGAMAIGERLFMNNCSGCHGSDARGGKGFPNLTDDDWLYGGSPEAIVETITHGRQGMMPPMAAAVGDGYDVQNVAEYVLSLSNSPHDAAAADKGRAKFVVCAGCHGVDGKGNQAIGAPNLTDDTWLHGSGRAAIIRMVEHGKTNVMPAQERRLTPAQIHVVGAYVWGLSHAGTAN
ncbi:MAG TPA: cytochrome-c oxidase, cbb3-type subunit III [Burkholderiaceae bacterium]